ncbi:lipopolysaccharide biosynthesis protein [Microbacterium trichothecenolyticum]|uniref:Teichuronic acid biosynthesis protein TuaB n=1 Tax=Microbacterium trichothecenolyticum TaxID=69370 RepID=A0A0M2HA10_MICTR|nr:lipopolysaccharide biosynthesis protein [Microbacterium trichothecenolyticum]KJL40820.1 Teichuronic acid biosynthesis protein TuaB [Microbacterium trichothecenolyticum]
MSADQTNLAGAAARGSGVTLLAQALRIGIHFTSIFVLSRLLTPTDFGMLAMVTAVVGVSEILRDLGLSMAAVQAATLSRAQKSNLFWINTASGALFATAVFLLAEPLAALFRTPELVAITHAVAVIYLINGISAQFRAEINRNLWFVRLSAVDIVPQLLGLAAAIMLAIGGAGYWALVAQLIIYSAGGLVLAVVFARWWPGLPARRANMRGLITFGISVTGTQAINYLVGSVPTVALGIAWNASVTGLYNRAYQLAMAPFAQVAAPLTRVAVPVISRVWNARPHAFESTLGKAQLVGSYVVAPLYFLLAGLAPSVIEIALGPQWSAAGPIFQAMCIGGVFRALTQISYWAYLSRGEAATQFKVYMWFQPVIVVCTLAGLPWGALGVAIGGSVGLFAYWVISLITVGRNLRLDGLLLLRRAGLSILLVGLPIGIIGWVVEFAIDQPLLAVGTGLAASAAYLGVLVLLSGRARGDLKVIVGFMRRAFA